jgi:hypothetical protein
MCGGWPPALEDCEDREVYEASMLLLFDPWRNLKKLKNGHDSFGKAFAEFKGRMSIQVRERIDHIQLYYECDWRNPDRIADGNSLYDKL